jgi:hypothetical protein
MEKGGVNLADWGGVASGVSFDTDKHGYLSASWHVSLPQYEAQWFASLNRALHVVISDGLSRPFEGRTVRMFASGTGLSVTAEGYRNALSDDVYTNLWSDDRVVRWRDVSDDEYSVVTPAKYILDRNNRLYIAPRLDTTYNENDAGGHTYAIPHQSDRDIVEFVFDYDYDPGSGGTDWACMVMEADDDFTSLTNKWGLNLASAQSGTDQRVVITSKARLLVLVYKIGSGSYTNTDDEGDVYLKLTNLRVTTVDTNTGADPITSDLIVDDMIDQIVALNSTQLSSAKHHIKAHPNDLDEAIYEDQIPSRVLDTLIANMDGQYRRWNWGVWEDQVVHFRPIYDKSRVWYVGADEIRYETSLREIINKLYAVYQDSRGITRRTADATESLSVSQFGLTRRRSVSVDTTSQSTAEDARDATLVGASDPQPRITSTWLDDGEHEGYLVRSNDLVQFTNISPLLGGGQFSNSVFPIVYTRYDVDTNLLSTEVGERIPTLTDYISESSPKRDGAIASASLIHSRPLLDNLVAWWNLDEEHGVRHDSFGSNHMHPAYHLTTIKGVDGRRCIEFDRANSHNLNRIGSDAMQFGDRDFSFCCWIYLNSVNLNQTFYSRWREAGARELRFYVTSANRLRAQITQDGTSASNVNGPTGLVLSTWYWVQMDYDATANLFSLRLNNGTASTKSVTGGTYSGDSNTMIGAQGTGGSGFDGRIQYAAFFDKVLTSTERGVIYNSGNAASFADIADYIG